MWKIKDVEIKNRIVFAPMAGISNISYRTIIKEMGAGLVYSEMISAKGIEFENQKTLDLLKISDFERPIAIQLFASTVNDFVNAAKYVDKNIKPDIIDLNMGCPAPKIALKSSSGSSLLKNTELIAQIVKNVVNNVSVPVTVKIRSGWDEEHINAVEVAKICEENGASAICIHPRTRSQKFSGKSNWDIIKDVKENVNIPVIGNGDIKTIYDAKEMLTYTGCDAVMIGRSTLGNPWFINECVNFIENDKIIDKPTNKDKIEMIKKHYKLLLENTNEKQATLEIRSHALWYLKNMPNNKDIKLNIMKCKTSEEFLEIINEYEKTISN